MQRNRGIPMVIRLGFWGTFSGVCSLMWARFSRRLPHRVVLFGSYAQGTATDDSDVDLLVIAETRPPPCRQSHSASAGMA